MALDAAAVETLQNSTPTDWAKFDARISPSDYGRGATQGDSSLHVEFFSKAVIDTAASNEANRPIYKNVPFVKIMIPGDKNNIVVEPVWDRHKIRFPEQWDQFQRGVAQEAVGTPLKVAPFLTEAHVAEFKHMKITTVEQLANLPDSALNFMGAREFKEAAKRYLLTTGDNAVLLERIKALEATIGAMSATPEPAAPRGPGRPRKQAESATENF